MKKRILIVISSILVAASTISGLTIWALMDKEPESEIIDPNSSYNFPYVINLASGEVFNFSEYSGKVVVIEFMTVECPYCTIQGNNFQYLYDTTEDRFFEVIKIDIGGSSDEALLSYMTENGFTYNIARDVAFVLSLQFVIYGTPTTIILNKNGTVYTQLAGARNSQELYNIFLNAYNT